MNMMKQDRVLLANLFESAEYKALRKLLANQQLKIAQAAIFAQDMKDVGFHQGQVQMIRWLDDEMKRNYKRNRSNG